MEGIALGILLTPIPYVAICGICALIENIACAIKEKDVKKIERKCQEKGIENSVELQKTQDFFEAEENYVDKRLKNISERTRNKEGE